RRSPRDSSLHFFIQPSTPYLDPLPLHDALPLSVFTAVAMFATATARKPSATSSGVGVVPVAAPISAASAATGTTPTPEEVAEGRSEEHTSELQSRENLVCRLLLEKKKSRRYNNK